MNELTKDKIAVFIPVYNASETIIETLNGIEVAASYLRKNIPIYIYDDCSKDKTYEILNDFKSENISIFTRKNDKNLGQWETCNRGFCELEKLYSWVFILHGDDIPKQDWLSTICKIIEDGDRSSVFTIWSSYDVLIHDSKKIIDGDNRGSVSNSARTPGDAISYLAKVTASWHVSGAAINMELWSKIGRFDSKLAQYGDTDYFVRGIIDGYRDIYISRTLTFYRIINSSESFLSKSSNRDINEMLYLADKYKTFLPTKERKKILLLGIKYGLRRSLKFLSKRKIQVFFKTIMLTVTCARKSLTGV